MSTKRLSWDCIGFVIPLLLAVVCLISVTRGTYQASLPIPMPQEFVGEYSYDGENWQPLTQKSDLSALNGDLLLRGTFLREMGEGWQLNFYRNHIGISIAVNGQLIYEDDMLAVPELHNPHEYGNKTAYRDFLSTLCSDPVEWSILEQNLAPHGEGFRILGVLLSVASLMLLGAAIAAVIVRIPVGGTLLKLGLLTLFAGGYVAFDSIDISYFSDLKVLNTYACQLCMMLAVFCLFHFVSDTLRGSARRVAKFAVLGSALFNSVRTHREQGV